MAAAHCNQLSLADAAYLAGFLDGEGSIMIVSSWTTPRLRVVLAQSARNRQVLEWVEEVTGLGATINKNRGDPQRHDLGLTWACHGQGASELLQQLLPYLRVKHSQAVLAVEFQERSAIQGYGQGEDHSWKDWYKSEMHELNRRGPSEVVQWQVR